MKTYTANKSRVRTSFLKKTLNKPPETVIASSNPSEVESIITPAQINLPSDPKAMTAAIAGHSRSLIDPIPASVEVKYHDGRTEMWSKQVYQRSEGRTAGKLDIVIIKLVFSEI